MKKILVVDDEKEIADLIELYLNNEGFEVYKCYSGNEALEYINEIKFDLALLDIMLPEINGFELCKLIRKQYFYPIIMITAKVEDMDKIMRLTLGADDYITKPFNPLEMMARVKTQLRRYVQYNQSEVQVENKQEHDINGLIINKATHKCQLYGKVVNLTPIEFSILWHLCENKGKVVSSEDLFEVVWGEKYLNNNNTVMAHIARLRDKIEGKTKSAKFIKTVWGVGYTIE